MDSRCHFNASDLEFLPSATNSSQLRVIRWMNFCRTMYVDKCDVYRMIPPPGNIPEMIANASYDDCFNTRNLAVYCLSIILSSVIICTNTVILVVFMKSRGLLTCPNIPILSLALSDFLTGITFTYSTTWNLVTLSAGYKFDIQLTISYIRQRTNYYLCMTFDGPGLIFACMMSSVLTLGVIAVERHVAVFYPFKYPYWITTPRMVCAILFVWLISLTVGILPLTGWNTWMDKCQLMEVMDYSYLLLWTTICFLSGFIMLYIYVRIFFLSRRHSRQIAATQVSSFSFSLPSTSDSAPTPALTRNSIDNPNGAQIPRNLSKSADVTSPLELPKRRLSILHASKLFPADGSTIPRSPDGLETQGGRRSRRGARPKPSRRAIITTVMILGAFYLSWTPFLVFLMAYHDDAKQDVQLNLTAYYLAVVTQLSAVFNPFFYGLRNPEIKTALRKLFSCRN